MSDRWTERLSEYLDGELSAAERERLEAHLAECEACAATLDQLRGVVARAQALENRTPAVDLWAGIAERIGAGKVSEIEAWRRRKEARLHERRLTFSLPQLAAASIALVVISAGAAWLVSRAGAPEPREGEVAVPGATSFLGAPLPGHAVSGYNEAIANLERVIDESRDRLDTTTVRIIEENLMIIDQAIVQAQRALVQDPGSAYLNEYLAATMRQKLEFLRQAAAMTGAVI